MTHDGATDALLSARSIRELLNVSDRALRRWVAGGKFPREAGAYGRKKPSAGKTG